MECYACEQEAIQRCSRCGNAYCSDHGDDPAATPGQTFCADCLDPVNATPSGVVFRASLLGLFIASVLALWLLIRPPSLPGESTGAIQPLPTTSPISPPGESSPSPGVSPEATQPPEATPVPETPAPTDAPAPTPIQYTMQEGDTVSGVAAAYGISYLDLLAANGLTEELALTLQPGDVIVVPQ
jgi:hypothetical protein